MSDDRLEKPTQFAILPAGKILGGYRIESVIGDGAHSVVYLATREQPAATDPDEAPVSDRVALKVIHRHLCGEPVFYKRFRRETEILTRLLQSEHVVKIFDVIEDESDGALAIALEYVEGMSLEARLRKGPIALPEAVEITLQICAALGAAHACDIVHRDLKPANVLISEEPGAPASAGRAAKFAEIRVKVVDFGLSRLVRHEHSTTNLTEQGMIFGTAEYMAPEQVRGDAADARSDLYAAGVMLFEMAVGELPFKRSSAIGTMAAHLSEAPPSPRSLRADGRISPALEAIILRAMAKDPADRYASARAFAEAIAGVDKVPVVLDPPRHVDIDQLGAGDTDLHLPPPSLATARTIPTLELSDATRAELDRGHAEHVAAQLAKTEAQPITPLPSATPRPSAPVAPRPSTTTAIPDTLQSPMYDPPPRSRWLWALVAIIAAAVGVVIGAIAGTR